MRIFLVLGAVLLGVTPAGAATKTATLLLDGARVESIVTAVKGYLEVPLPGGVQAGSLRVKPLGGGSITRVEVVPVKPNRKQGVELAQLEGRKDALQDRLKALDTREEIFKAAAKSQSGKAPRKTKNNPEPMANIRQGTEFAIAQLESVYRARRKTENELKSLEARMTALKKEGNVGGHVARVWLSGKEGRVSVSYLRSDLKWTPTYDFRVGGEGTAEVAMSAVLPPAEKGTDVAVLAATLADASGETPQPAAGGGFSKVAVLSLPVEKVQHSQSPQSSLAFSVTNLSQKTLPPGEAACYWKGEYLGKSAFQGFRPGETREMVFGK